MYYNQAGYRLSDAEFNALQLFVFNTTVAFHQYKLY